MFCERCGLQFLQAQSVCTRCGVVATRCWFQLMSLLTLMVAVACNSLVVWFLLPHGVARHRAHMLFRAWLWLDEKGSLYGWVPLALGLLAWDYFVWRESRPKIKGWITRKLLFFVLIGAVAPVLPWWIPAGQPPDTFLAGLAKHPGLPQILSWGIVILVITLLCINAETRDILLGHGRVLSLVSVAVLLLVLTMTLVGWSITYR
jgi:hypothetical protein